MPRVLITGAAGFAGSHIAAMLAAQGMSVVAVDSLTYAGSLDALMAVPNLQFVCHDIAESLPLKQIGKIDYLVHNAAESHVDRSFQDTGRLVKTNVMGTLNVIEAARELKAERLVYTSTDEVFGPRRKPAGEEDTLSPTNPYAATKAAGEMLLRGMFSTLPVTILRTVNMFGERQHSEKFVPMAVRKILAGEEVEIHASADGEIGSRQWVYVGRQAELVSDTLKAGGRAPLVRHLAGPIVSNLDMAELIARLLGKRLAHRKAVSARPFHDLHYFLGGSGPVHFETELAQTVRWYAENRSWL